MPSHAICCHQCRHSWSYEPPLARKAECPACGADAHVCLNCSFYDRGAHHECREVQAEWVKDKGRSNFCSYFQPLASHAGGGGAGGAKARLDALFGGPQTGDGAGRAKSGGLAADLAAFLAGKKP